MLGTTIVFALLAAMPSGDRATLVFIDSGASAKIGSYSPVRVNLQAEPPSTLKTPPPGLEAPMYGVIPVPGVKDRLFHVIVDEPEGRDAVLYVDSNGDGDLTNDPPAEWKPKRAPARAAPQGEGKPDAAPPKEFTTYNGGATIKLGVAGAERDAHINAYRFDKNDPGRAQLKQVLLVYRDYAVEGEVAIGGKSHRVMLDDGKLSGDFSGKSAGGDAGKSAVRLLIDVNGNGKFDRQGEAFSVDEPFNIGGTTYELAEIAADGTSLAVVRSDKTVAEVPTPPDLGVGKTILGFEARDLDGNAIAFPRDYRGKLVLLDFWATWCGPCMVEMPNVVKAHEAYREQGFEVLGISLDNPDAVDKIRKVTGEKGMKWAQVYDGGGWKAKVAVQFAIHSIPQAFLVDGDTGEILATGDGVRGEALAKSIQAGLAKLAGKKG